MCPYYSAQVLFSALTCYYDHAERICPSFWNLDLLYNTKVCAMWFNWCNSIYLSELIIMQKEHVRANYAQETCDEVTVILSAPCRTHVDSGVGYVYTFLSLPLDEPSHSNQSEGLGQALICENIEVFCGIGAQDWVTIRIFLEKRSLWLEAANAYSSLFLHRPNFSLRSRIFNLYFVLRGTKLDIQLREQRSRPWIQVMFAPPNLGKVYPAEPRKSKGERD